MRNYAELVELIRSFACNQYPQCEDCEMVLNGHECRSAIERQAADAIKELLAVCRDVAAFVIHYADEDNVSAEVLCRKLNKIGVVEKDGAWWTLPEPPKEVE